MLAAITPELRAAMDDIERLAAAWNTEPDRQRKLGYFIELNTATFWQAPKLVAALRAIEAAAA